MFILFFLFNCGKCNVMFIWYTHSSSTVVLSSLIRLESSANNIKSWNCIYWDGLKFIGTFLVGKQNFLGQNQEVEDK